MPESPRWLIAHGKLDAAKLAIARVRAVSVDNDHVRHTYDEMCEDVEKERADGEGTWKDALFGHPKYPKLAYRTYLVMILQALQQLTGANYFFYVSRNCQLSDSR